MAGEIEVDTTFTFRFFPETMEKIVIDPEGPVSMRVKLAAERTLELGNQKIGVRYSGHHPEREKKLAESGSVKKAGQGTSWKVVWDHEAAVYHHRGTGEHEIGAPGQILINRRDPARTAGGRFGAKGPVTHKGAKANPFAADAIRELGLTPSGSLREGAGPPTGRLVDIGRVPTGFA